MNRLGLGQSRLFEDEEKKYEMKQVGNKANIGSSWRDRVANLGAAFLPQMH
jgi:hypothetical protein